MIKLILYFNGSSLNHGCEAISRSVIKILKDNKCLLYSFNKEEDLSFGLDKILEINTLDIIYHNKISKIAKIYRILPQCSAFCNILIFRCHIRCYFAREKPKLYLISLQAKHNR